MKGSIVQRVVEYVTKEIVEDGDAVSVTIVEDGPEWERAKALLDAKYPQYEPMFPIVAGEGLMVFVTIERVTSEGF